MGGPESKYLVEELGADINFVADTGETAMHAAAYREVVVATADGQIICFG